MDPPLDDPLKVRFHLCTGNLHQDPERVVLPLFHGTDIGPDDQDLTVRDRFRWPDADDLELFRLRRPAQLDLHAPHQALAIAT